MCYIEFEQMNVMFFKQDHLKPIELPLTNTEESGQEITTKILCVTPMTNPIGHDLPLSLRLYLTLTMASECV